MSKEQRAKLQKRSRSCSPSRGRMDVRQVQTHPALLKALGQTTILGMRFQPAMAASVRSLHQLG